jgi:hypothetical protein
MTIYDRKTMAGEEKISCWKCGTENPSDSVFCGNCGQRLVPKTEKTKRPLGITLCSAIGIMIGLYLVGGGFVVLALVSPVLELEFYEARSLLYSAIMATFVYIILGFGLAVSSYGMWKGKSWSHKWANLLLGLLLVFGIRNAVVYSYDIWEVLFIVLEITLLVYLNTPVARRFFRATH